MSKSYLPNSILAAVMLLAALTIQMVGFKAVPVAANDSTATESDLLQFTSGGHILDFSSGGVMITSADHMLKTDFVNANPVQPQSDAEGDRDFSRVTYNGLWNGVDLIYESNPGSVLKSTYYISPNDIAGSVEQIRLQYNRPVILDSYGNLVTSFDMGNMTESRPMAWQEVDGQKKAVTAGYRLYSDYEVGFTIEDYLPGLPLVIDPSVTWNTFLGGNDVDNLSAVTVDSSSNVYVCGYSFATWGAPLNGYTGSSDAFVAKLDSSGNLTWHTFMGSAGGLDTCYGIALDGAGNICTVGNSNATWGNNPAQLYVGSTDVCVAKLTTNGALTWHAFLGCAGMDSASAIAVDNGNNIYIGGHSPATWGSPEQPYTGNTDAFVARLTAAGALDWNTFVGGAGGDVAIGVAVDANSVYTCGYSDASWGMGSQRPYSAAEDGFVAKLARADGSLTWHTFLGGNSADYCSGIALDGGGNIYVSGYSSGTWGGPVRGYSGSHDGFAVKLANDGTLSWSTFLGSAGYDDDSSIAVDDSGNVYVAGYCDATWGSATPAFSGSLDIVVAKLDSASGALSWTAFAGGAGDDQTPKIALDNNGDIYLAGQSFATWGTPVQGYTASGEGFVAKLDPADPVNPGGGHGNSSVGGTFTPVNRLALIVPLLALALVVISGGSLLFLRRHKVS